MVAPVQDRSYQRSAMALQMQCGFTLLGFAVTALRLADLKPLALGSAMQTLAKVVMLGEKRLLKDRPAQVLGFVIGGSVICASYTLASQLDPVTQAVCALAFLLCDVKVIGPRHVWKELKMSRVKDNVAESSKNAAANAMRFQVSCALLALVATAMRIANLQPFAMGFAASCLAKKELKVLKKYPDVLQIIALGGVFCAAYALVTPLDLKIQALCFCALLALQVAKIGPENAWKELKA